MNEDMKNFLEHLDRTIDLSNIFVAYCAEDREAFWLLTRQIEDLANAYKKVDRLLECI